MMTFDVWWENYRKHNKDPDLCYYRDHMRIAYNGGFSLGKLEGYEEGVEDVYQMERG